MLPPVTPKDPLDAPTSADAPTRAGLSTDSGGNEAGKVARRAGLVGVGILLSRILGAARDAVIAGVFALGVTDTFFMAFTIPNALRVLFGEGAASGAFVPVLTEAREKEGPARARRVLAGLMGVMVPLLALISALGVLAAAPLVLLYASGFDAERMDRTVSMTRVVFPYIFFMGVAALITAALHMRKRFAAPSFAPALLNVAVIVAALVAVPMLRAAELPTWYALAGGVMVGGLLQVLALLPSLKRVDMVVWPRPPGGDPYVRKALKLLVPLLAALGVYQLNVVCARQLASYLGRGPVSWLWYAQRLVEIPQGMFAIAIASAALPSLSEAVSRGEQGEATKLFGASLRMSLFVAIPSTVALMVLARPAIAVLFGRGAFGPESVSEAAFGLVFQAAGIWAVASVRVVVPMFHAYNDTRTPVIASFVNLVVFGTVSLLLMGPMRHGGLTLAISLAAAFQLAALLGLLRRKTGPLGLRVVAEGAARMWASAALMGAAVYAVALLGRWERGGNDVRNVAVFLACVVIGAGVYFAAAKLLRVPEAQTLVGGLARRLRRKRA